MWTEIIGLLQPAWNVLKKVWKFFSLWRYKRVSRRPPLDAAVAKEIAYATLGGRIEEAISYRNINTHKTFLAVLYVPTDKPFVSRTAILEETGESYRTLWKSDVQGMRALIEVEDIDGDGCQELVIQSADWGTGAHSNFLSVYSHRYKNLYTISEFVNRQNLAGPMRPEITFDPEPPEVFRAALERHGMKKGFLQAAPQVEWNSPRFAIQRWHRDNGADPSGKINLVLYDADPPHAIANLEDLPSASIQNQPFASTIVASLDDGEILWTSFFKNPLVGYIKGDKKWFIAYSPSNFYYWATSLAHDGKRLWFGVHSLEAIYSFEYEAAQLLRHRSIRGVKFGMDSTVDHKDGHLIIDGSRSFTQKEIDEACSEYRPTIT